jgi:hypothetical protein
MGIQMSNGRGGKNTQGDSVDGSQGEMKKTAVVAVGSQDNGISVWMTGSSRAVVSAQQVFTHSCLDLAWYPLLTKGVKMDYVSWDVHMMEL